MLSNDLLLEQSLGATDFSSTDREINEDPRKRIDITLQTNGRRKLTIISGLADEKTCKGICKKIKKDLAVGGAVKKDEETKGWIVQTQGDKRHEVRTMLSEVFDISPDSIMVHGY